MRPRLVRMCIAFVIVALAAIGTLWAGGKKESPGGSAGGAAPVTLTMWDIYNTPGQHKVIEAVIADFTAKHPNVTVDETYRTLDADKTATLAALNAGAGPDIVTANNGETEMGPMVRAGQLVNLSPYSATYGWEKNYLSPSLWARAKYTADGKTFGEGNLYGVPLYGELVGVYYNKDLFAKYGVAVPKTLGDFEKAAQTFKNAGVVPIAYGAAEMWPFYHLYGEILGATLADEKGGDAAESWLSGTVIKTDPSLSFDDPAVLKAAQIVQDSGNNGYFFKNFTGLKIEDALQYFLAGQAAMYIQGSWDSATIAAANFKSGIFAFPPVKESTGMVPQVGGMATPVGINHNSPHKELAAEFLNTMLSSAKAHQLERDIAVLPPTVPADVSVAKAGSLYYELLTLWNNMNAKNRVGQYLDWTTPSMGDVMGQAGQALLANKITPQQFVDKVEADYKAWVAKKSQ